MPHDGSLFATLADGLETGWHTMARPEQLAPLGDWTIWLILAGRGWGKTRTGAEWVNEQVRQGKRRIALVGATAADARDIMVEGASGLLATAPSWNRPEYEPSKRRVTWPNGALATVYSADEPERLRGPEHDAAWCDEVGAWRLAREAWDNLQLGLRLGKRPQVVVTTTPKRIALLRELLAREGGDVRVTRGKTRDNAANLAGTFMSTITARYEGTRLGRQELDGEMIEDVAGALWQRDWIDRDRIAPADLPQLVRIVIAIDPAVTSGEDADESGIIAAGKDARGHGYVLDDGSGRYQPHEWAAEAIRLYRQHMADRIVAEVNQGGEMVKATIHAVDPKLPFKSVHASRGKVTRAEPIATFYERGMVHHVGSFPTLEDQQCAFTADFDRRAAGYSPDRVDALVWAMTELLGGAPTFNASQLIGTRTAFGGNAGLTGSRTYG